MLDTNYHTVCFWLNAFFDQKASAVQRKGSRSIHHHTIVQKKRGIIFLSKKNNQTNFFQGFVIVCSPSCEGPELPILAWVSGGQYRLMLLTLEKNYNKDITR